MICKAEPSIPRLVAKIEEIALAKGVTSAQLAPAWLCVQSDSMNAEAVTIPGTRKRTRLAENVAAVSIALTAEEIGTLEPLAAGVKGIAVRADRCNARSMTAHCIWLKRPVQDPMADFASMPRMSAFFAMTILAMDSPLPNHIVHSA